MYRTLVSNSSASRSASEIAERHGYDADVIEQVLLAFDAAGICEAVDGPGGTRHRWRAEMDYLFSDAADGRARVDPVCGMPVADGSPYFAEDLHARTRRFCSSLCLVAFLAFRATFSGPPPVFREGG